MKNIHLKKHSQNTLKSHFSKVFLTALLTLVVSAFTSCKSSPDLNGRAQGATDQTRMAKGTGEISVMSFNVENMFDNVHNAGVNDYTYLPLAQKKTPEVQAYCKTQSNSFYRSECFNKNWNDAAVNFKISQVAQVISYVDGGKGPDNLLIAEIENENILKMLVNGPLKDLGYKTVAILKGPDTRGINTAFISKFPMVGKPILHVIPYTDPGAKKSRGILETTVKINNRNITFLSAHFPSQSNDTSQRREAMEYMKKLMLDIQSQGRAVIAGGDLNTIGEEEEDYGYFSKILSQAGQVSHLVGCKQCQGTHNYKGEWSFLDVIVYGNNLPSVGGLELIPESIDVVKAPVHTKPNGTPIRFDEVGKVGVSDHFPLYSRLRILN